MDANMAGGIAGSIIGVMGGVIGTFFSIRNTTRPRERALMLRLAALCWLWLAVLGAWLFLMPRPWNQAAVLLNMPILLSIPRMNRWLARARAEDELRLRNPSPDQISGQVECSMHYGTATVTKVEEADLLTVTVSVTVEQPEMPESSYMRCRDDSAPEYCQAGAISGVRYARHTIDSHRFGIEVQEVRGSLDHPAAGKGAAMAAMFAVWLAWGYRWTEAEAHQTMGWSLSESVES